MAREKAKAREGGGQTNRTNQNQKLVARAHSNTDHAPLSTVLSAVPFPNSSSRAMSQHRSHIIPHNPRQSVRSAQHEEEARRADALESYRQYRLMASAPIIWPPSLARQQQQQLAFLWEQLDPR